MIKEARLVKWLINSLTEIVCSGLNERKVYIWKYAEGKLCWLWLKSVERAKGSNHDESNRALLPATVQFENECPSIFELAPHGTGPG